MVLDCVYEVIYVVLRELLHIKVVDAKGEGCSSGAVFPEAWGVLHWVISEGCHFLDKFFECDDAGFFEAIHSSADFEVYVSVGSDGEFFCRS